MSHDELGQPIVTVSRLVTGGLLLRPDTALAKHMEGFLLFAVIFINNIT